LRPRTDVLLLHIPGDGLFSDSAQRLSPEEAGAKIPRTPPPLPQLRKRPFLPRMNRGASWPQFGDFKLEALNVDSGDQVLLRCMIASDHTPQEHLIPASYALTVRSW
jgi:hypothetical protein